LTANGLVNDEELRPVLLVDWPPRRVENLDSLYGSPPAQFAPDQMAHIPSRPRVARRYWLTRLIGMVVIKFLSPVVYLVILADRRIVRSF
jgi:hypothetical protein